MIGDTMVAAWNYVHNHPGASKREVARSVPSPGTPQIGKGAVNRAMRAGLIYATDGGKGALSLHAWPVKDLSPAAVMDLALYYRRKGADIPGDIIDAIKRTHSRPQSRKGPQ